MEFLVDFILNLSSQMEMAKQEIARGFTAASDNLSLI